MSCDLERLGNSTVYCLSASDYYFSDNLIFLCPLASTWGNVNNLINGKSLNVLETGTMLVVPCENGLKWLVYLYTRLCLKQGQNPLLKDGIQQLKMRPFSLPLYSPLLYLLHACSSKSKYVKAVLGNSLSCYTNLKIVLSHELCSSFSLVAYLCM